MTKFEKKTLNKKINIPKYKVIRLKIYLENINGK